MADLPEVHWSRDRWPATTPAASLGGMPTAFPVTFGQIRKIEINYMGKNWNVICCEMSRHCLAEIACVIGE